VEQEGIVCSECNTLNEVGWAFCQQCGKRLVQPQPQPSPPPAQPPAELPQGLKTVLDQQAVVVPRSPESFRTVVGKVPQIDRGFETVAERPPPAERDLRTVVATPPPPVDHGLRTVVETPPPPERDLRTVVATPPPPVAQEPRTVREEPRAVEPEVAPEVPVRLPPPPPVVPPRIIEAPVAAPPPVTRSESPAAPPEVAAPPRIVEPPKAAMPAPPQPKPAVPPPDVALAPATLIGQPGSGVLCSQCGQSSGVGSAFCASCGAPIAYGKTMVIASQPAPPALPKGSLHLVMEGGQSGEVYELGDETVIGRNNGKITFPHDGFMSGRHARIELRDRSFILTDEGSRNGTFVKIQGEVELKPGDTILVGKQLFRFEIVE
jgi:hypothetical protein